MHFMTTTRILIKSIFAGILVGLGGIVYLTVENKYVGSFLFSFALMTILIQGLYLYTGKVGYANSKETWCQLPIILVGNYIGTFLMAFAAKQLPRGYDGDSVIFTKMSNSTVSVWILSILCGMLMYLAVDNYRKSNQFLLVIVPVMIFILVGCEHSIADMFFINLKNDPLELRHIGFLLTTIVGNGIGAKIIQWGVE
jgi:nitrite transporter NirC